MERIKTCIPGLDEILGGGLAKSSVTLLTGLCGTGKTIFGVQFTYLGAKKYNENGVYLSFEEPIESIKANTSEFGWSFKELEESGKFTFVRYDPFHVEDIFDMLETTIRERNAKRVCIDSISALGLHVRDKAELRRMIFNLSLILRKTQATAILISEITPGAKGISRYGVEEFVSDAVIVLYYERTNSSFSRAIQVWKMRGSAHSEKIHPYKITSQGIVVYPKEEAFIRI